MFVCERLTVEPINDERPSVERPVKRNRVGVASDAPQRHRRRSGIDAGEPQ